MNIIFAIFLFGDIWGFAGMLIGVPLFAVIYHLITNAVFAGLDKRGQREMEYEYRDEYPDKDTIKQAKIDEKEARRQERAMKKQAKENGFEVILLNSGLLRNDAHSFYESQGYSKNSYGFIKKL